MIRVFGAILIILGCGGFGFIVLRYKKYEILALENFILATEYMICELRYRMTPLPNLCHATAAVTKGIVRRIFISLGKVLELQSSASVSDCIDTVLKENPVNSDRISTLFLNLGMRLGVFDLDGQIDVLASLRDEGRRVLKSCRDGYEIQSRSCGTIALCAGAALAILLI